MTDPWDAILALQAALRRMDARIRELERIDQAPNSNPGIMDLVKQVCAETGLSEAGILSNSRKGRTAEARQEVMYRASVAGKSNAEIAEFFGKDWATVSHGINKMRLRHDAREFWRH